MAIRHHALLAASVLCFAANRSMAQVTVGDENPARLTHAETALGDAGVAELPTIDDLGPSADVIVIDSVTLMEGARAATADLLFAGFPDLLIVTERTGEIDALSRDSTLAIEPSEASPADTAAGPVALAALGIGLVGLGVWAVRRSARTRGKALDHRG